MITVKSDDRLAMTVLLQEGELVEEACRRALFEAGIRGKKDLLDGLTREGKSGVLARDKNGVLFHRSAPGQFPSLDSGRLRKTVDYEVRGSLEMELGAGDSTEATKYAEYLEQGTSKMAPRPYVKPTIEKQHTYFIADLAQFTEELMGI